VIELRVGAEDPRPGEDDRPAKTRRHVVKHDKVDVVPAGSGDQVSPQSDTALRPVLRPRDPGPIQQDSNVHIAFPVRLPARLTPVQVDGNHLRQRPDVEVVADPLHRRGEVGLVWHVHKDADIFFDMMKAARINPKAGISRDVLGTTAAFADNSDKIGRGIGPLRLPGT
jgi:hypothetical protein